TYTDPLSQSLPLSQSWSWHWSYDGSGVLTSVERKSPIYHDADGAQQSAIQTEHHFGLRGQITDIVAADNSTTKLEYNGDLESGKYLLKKVRRDVYGGTFGDIRTVYTTDDLGRLHYVEEGEGSGRVVEYDQDIYFHPIKETSPPAGGAVRLEINRYYDRRGNLTVLQLPTRNEKGVAHTRATIERQWLHDLWDRTA